MKAFFRRFLLCVTFITIILMVSACGNAPKPMSVVIFSAGDISKTAATSVTLQNTPQPVLSTNTPQFATATNTPNLDFWLADEQKAGYSHAETETNATPIDGVTPIPTTGHGFLVMDYQLQNSSQESIAQIVRDRVVNEKTPVIALVGASSDDGSRDLASLPNAFEVPLIIPSSMGDNVLPPNNSWVFRLSASGAKHAQYFFDDVLNLSTVASFSDPSKDNDVLSESPTPTLTPTATLTPTSTPTLAPSSSASPIPSLSATPLPQILHPFKIAILYERDDGNKQNTFDESAAAAAANGAMKQGIVIGLYDSFDPSNMDTQRLTEQIDEIKKQGVHLVYLITNRLDAAKQVVQAIKTNIPKDEMPVLLGQSGAFSSLKFLESTEAQNMYVLRQKIIRGDSCPTSLTSLAQVQSYAAVVLLRSVIKQARSTPTFDDSQTLVQKRASVRSVLQTINIEDLACLGPVSFDETGQNKKVPFEILQIDENRFAVTGDPAFNAFIAILESTYNRTNTNNRTNSNNNSTIFDTATPIPTATP